MNKNRFKALGNEVFHLLAKNVNRAIVLWNILLSMFIVLIPSSAQPYPRHKGLSFFLFIFPAMFHIMPGIFNAFDSALLKQVKRN